MDSTQPAVPGHGAWPELPAPLSIPVPDSHCHLDIEFSPDKYGPGLSIDDAIAHAASVGVNKIVQIGCDIAGARWAVDTAQRHPEIVAGVAIHPNEAPRLAASGELMSALRVIEQLATDPNVLVVGETGLDYYRTAPAGRASQEESFRWHIRLANKLDKTLVIHDRDAHDDVVRVLLDEGAPNRVVFHCFSGGVELASTCAANRWFMSFSGTVTFKANGSLRDALSTAPTDLLLVETDAPFLAPLPHRGRPNASYLVPWTVRTMAQVKGLAEAEMAAKIALNTEAAIGRW